MTTPDQLEEGAHAPKLASGLRWFLGTTAVAGVVLAVSVVTPARADLAPPIDVGQTEEAVPEDPVAASVANPESEGGVPEDLVEAGILNAERAGAVAEDPSPAAAEPTDGPSLAEGPPEGGAPLAESPDDLGDPNYVSGPDEGDPNADGQDEPAGT